MKNLLSMLKNIKNARFTPKSFKTKMWILCTSLRHIHLVDKVTTLFYKHLFLLLLEFVNEGYNEETLSKINFLFLSSNIEDKVYALFAFLFFSIFFSIFWFRPWTTWNFNILFIFLPLALSELNLTSPSTSAPLVPLITFWYLSQSKGVLSFVSYFIYIYIYIYIYIVIKF